MRIPFGTITTNNKTRELILECLDKNRFSSGRLVREFEKRFADLVGVQESVAVSSGTDAVALALAVLYDFGARRGDEIIMPALSFVATANAVLQAGFTPVFVDIDPLTLNINPLDIDTKISSKTRALLPVHLMGKPAPMNDIKQIADKQNLRIIEDAAEAHGASYYNDIVGGIGDMGAFSLYVAHIISTVEGGIITTNNDSYAEVLRSLRSHGRACKCKSCVLNTESAHCNKRFQYGKNRDIRFHFERVGFSTKMNELEAAVGLGNLDTYDEILEKRRKNLYRLMEGLSSFSTYIYTIRKETFEDIGPHALPIIIKEQAPFERDEITAYLENNGIDTRTLFASIPTQCGGYEFLGHRLGDFPHAERIGEKGLHIGVHQDIGDKECDYILETLSGFFSQF